MPEGDTIHGAADQISAALAGEVVTAAGGSHRAMIEYGRRIVGATTVGATAHGKHLLIDFSNGWTLRTHLQMTGAWHLYSPDQRWHKSPGKARVVLETANHVAVCFAAPTVQLAPRDIVAAEIAGLGPDLMTETDFLAVAHRLASAAPDEIICSAITDQSLVAGLGNVYKSELLFLARIHPDVPVSTVGAEAVAALLERGHELLSLNRGRSRTTTGSSAPGGDTWVYGRSKKPCRRCGTTIEYSRHGPLQRDTYWCPGCQPPPPSRT